MNSALLQYIRRVAPVLVVACALMVSGCSDPGPAPQELVMGSTADTASRVATAIYAGALRGAGAAVSDEHPVADYGGLLDQMDNRTVDLFPAWSGELLAQLDPGASGRTSEDVYNQLNQALPQGVSAGDATTVQNKPLVFVSSDLAAEPAPQTVSDLAGAGCAFGPARVMDAQAAVAEVAAGRAAGLFSALGVVADDAGLQGLDDGNDAMRAQDLVPIFRTAALSRTLFRAMNKVAGELTTADLTTMAAEVDGGAELSGVATRWLGEHSL
ncbi:MAG: glycine/betaine ABC transporter substrate-binding protein [Gordonia sp. (in: high G+C Gram-positive bacteria)]|nr:MAG: glycine/betaine ABC transporter substrate-binding protein [Gordonia sp. (in: high G+C Gram-positive bacteria)]